MPSKSYRKARRNYRRRAMKKSSLSRGISNDKRMFRAKVAGILPVSFGASLASQTKAYSWCLNYPLFYRDEQGTRASLLTTTAAVSTVAPKLLGTGSIFDQYRVMSVKVSFVPNESQVLNTSNLYQTADAPSVIYSFNDRDSDDLLVGETQALNRGIAPRTYVPGKAIRYVFKQPRANRNGWCNTTGYTLDPSDTDTPITEAAGMSGLGASLKTMIVANVGTATVANYYVGRFYVEWDVLFKSINPGS